MYEPEPGFVGTDSIEYTIVDSEGERSTAVVTIEIVAPNLPRADEPPTTTTTTTTATTAPTTTTTTAPTTTTTTRPATTTTAAPTTTTTTAATTTTAPNLRPSAAGDTATAAEDSNITIDVLANDEDADDDTLTVTAASGAQNGSTAVTNNRVVYTPSANFNGTDQFSYSISDGVNSPVSATVSVTVTPVNDTPTVTVSALPNVTENAAPGTVVASVSASDVDGDNVVVSIASGNTGGVFAIAGGSSIVVAGSVDFEAQPSYTLTISASDGSATTTTNATVSVTDVDEVPTAASDSGPSFTTDEDVPLTTGSVLDNDSDPEDGGFDPSTIVVVASPPQGTLTNNGDGTF